MTVPRIFDAGRVTDRLRRAERRQASGKAANWLRDSIAEDVIERLGFLRWEGRTAAVLGDWGGAVARYLEASGVEVACAPVMAFDGRHDLIVTLCELDTINDLPGALIRLRHALVSGGLLIAAFPGAGSLPRMRAAMFAADGERPQARIHPQVDAQAGSALLARAGFARQAVDHHALTVRYAALETLVSDLRDQALSSVLADRAKALGKAGLQRARESFAAMADPDGKVSETFEIVTLTAWRD